MRHVSLRTLLLPVVLLGWAAVASAQSTCCFDQGPGNAGCDDLQCESCVCAVDPQCCDVGSAYWDFVCAAEAADATVCAAQCPCGMCGDSTINRGEQCDEGADNGGVSCCSGTCMIQLNGNVCRGLASDPTADFTCDVVETCGGSGLCVGGSNNGGSCSGPLDCDPTSGGKCTAECPADTFQGAATPCRNSQGVCDPAEECTGSGALCPDDAKSTSQCRGSAGICDPAELCDGVGNDCPMDAKSPSSQQCRASAGACDPTEFCTGSGDDCPMDAKSPATQVCRPVANDCDIVELCDGTNNACPPNAFKTDGTLCIGTDTNSCKNACVVGVCSPNTPVTVQPCCGNGILDPGEQCDDGNQFSSDSCPSLPGDNCQLVATGRLIRGSRRKPSTDKKDCQLEWSVASDPLNPKDRYGLLSNDQTCQDQDPRCDFDPTPGRCRFQVAVCLNNNDPNLLCGAGPNGVSSVTLLPPLRRYKKYAEVQNLVTNDTSLVQAAINALLDPANPGAGYTSLPPLSPSQTGFCSSVQVLDAFSSDFPGFSSKTVAMVFKTKSTDNSVRPLKQLSQLTLHCAPRPR